MQAAGIKTIDEYLALFSEPVQQRMRTIRKIIKTAAPECVEAIKYGMPTFMLEGNMLYFAAYERHIGLYGVPVELPPFKPQLEPYKTGKGSVQLPHKEPLPVELIKKLVEFQVAQHLEKVALKKLVKSKVAQPKA
jgi:uncharacterized protein YdhG (YjbR/CyaY superfamily)